MKRILALIYVAIYILSINAQNSKLSPFVRQAMMESRSNSSVSMAKSMKGHPQVTMQTITAFVRTTDTDALRQHGCNIYARWDDIVIASIPLDQLGTLATMSEIQRIEAGHSCSVTNDTTATVTRAREVWDLTPASLRETPSSNAEGSHREGERLTGEGVVVGVMDIGFDLTHPTFYSSNGQTYRIKQLWDQLDQTQGGEAVIGKTADDRDTIYVGRQYIGQEALLALKHSSDGEILTHGTHTTGTAAGSGWQGVSNLSSLTSNLYSGMAPDADICLVCNKAGDNDDLIPQSERYKYTTATDMLGFKYIFDYADNVGKPCVISFSEGAYDDFKESRLYSEVLSKMLGPGHILCASAGNNGGGDGTYMRKAEGVPSKGAFVAKWAENKVGFTMCSTKPVNMALSFYKGGNKAREWTYDVTELSQYPDSVFKDTIKINNDSIAVSIQAYMSCYDKTKYAMEFSLTDLKHDRYGYSTPTILTVTGEENDIEVFGTGGYFIKNDIDPSLTDYDKTHNILFPGSSQDVVCVGATSYVTAWKNVQGDYVGDDYGTDGERATYSSVGPTLNGVTKPDVMAPGTNVISSISSFCRNYNSEILLTEYDGRTYPWGIMTGTSMATPVTAGIVALWLQVCPTLTPNQVKDVIAHTATHYVASTGSPTEYPNNYYGWGQIDAKAGVEYIQQTYTGIEEVQSYRSQVPSSDAFYTLDGRRIKSIEGLHGLFIVNGKKVAR